ncbi:transglycosylase SLT domain-containing protein [Bradyrhizobium elkanii]|nr:transglycosylase SLT domain-containing protein [Bradyrhizobium elkanii]
MGAAELSALLSEYRNCHIMTFAGYNAGRGRVRDWIKAYGDPRDPKVDPVDWWSGSRSPRRATTSSA